MPFPDVSCINTRIGSSPARLATADSRDVLRVSENERPGAAGSGVGASVG
jgi:hypothetical protein